MQHCCIFIRLCSVCCYKTEEKLTINVLAQHLFRFSLFKADRRVAKLVLIPPQLISVEIVTVDCFQIEPFRWHGVLNASTTHCSKLCVKMNNGNNKTKYIYSFKECPLRYLYYYAHILFPYFACTSNIRFDHTECITSAFLDPSGTTSNTEDKL